MVHKGFVIDFAYIIEDRIPYQHTNEYIHTYKYIHIISHTELLQQKGHTNSFGFTCRNYYCQMKNHDIGRKKLNILYCTFWTLKIYPSFFGQNFRLKFFMLEIIWFASEMILGKKNFGTKFVKKNDQAF